MNRLWYKNAIIYSLDIETYNDSNHDGIGDINGLKHRLNYLAGLGVSCLWLLPFYDSPNKDNGYDIRDYFKIDPRLGDMGHFAELVDTAEEFGIRILIDLVVNHTSDQHFWFQEARRKKDSRYRKYFIWVDEKPQHDAENVIFGDHQGGTNWHYDEVAGAYFYHTFYPHQPDLNISNPEVQKEILRIMHFWLKLGISGFRLDAAPHMIQQKGNERFDGDPHQVFRTFREFVESQRRDAVLLAEVDTEPEKYKDFFGEEDQMNLLLNFYVDNYLFLALARGEATPLVYALKTLPENSLKEQLATFLRNHDELDLERLTEGEREEVYRVFGPHENMRIYGRGIRRRLAPMLGNDRKKLEFVFSLLLTLPGTPVIWYGQEIGMGDDLSLEGRNCIRTIMQWSGKKNAGFSDVPTEQLVTKVIAEGEFSYEKVNVDAQQRDPDSFLNWVRRAISFRKESPEFGWGKYDVINTNNPKVLAHSCKTKNGCVIAIHNFSDQEETVSFEVEDVHDFMDMFGNKRYDPFDTESKKLILTAHGYRWICKREI